VFVAMGVAVAGATWGIRAATQVSRSHSRIASLQAQLTSLEERVAADERTAASARQQLRSVAVRAGDAQHSLQHINWALQSVPTQAEIGRVRDDVAASSGCVRQLQREIAGLTLTWKIYPANPSSDSFKLFTTTPASAACGASR
jgi:hypothetical protein